MKIMIKIKNLMLFVLLCAQSYQGRTQVLDNENKLTITLKDKTVVNLYGQAASLSDAKTNNYYYLPCNLRLSKKKDGTPEFLFLKFTSDDKNATGVAQGGLLHLLMEFGLTQEQEKELQGLLKAKNKEAVLKGAADVDPDGDNSVRIISATLNTKEMTRNLVFNGKAPTFPGSKIAVAAMLDKQGAQIFAATLEKTKSISDLSINLSWQFTTRVPAAKGYIREDWSKMDSIVQRDSATYTKTTSNSLGGIVGAIVSLFVGDQKEEKYSYDEMRAFYRTMEEQKIITLRFEENVADERVDKIREAFFQHFLNSFTEKDGGAAAREPSAKEKQAIPDIKTGDSYTFKREMKEVIKQKKVQTFDLSYAMAVKRSYQITENFASWYDQHKDNPKCVGVVNLNDPFFLHREINVILDLDAEEMMGKEVNYATVNIRKQRSEAGANDFQQDVTFDKKMLEKEGNRVTVTYSKGQDEAPELYEYKVQWSLRGGMTFPPNDTTWTKGSWQGLNLAPPVMPRTIHFEADIPDMKNLGIKNATLQIRYKKFGNEVETNIGINASAQEGSAEKMIFMDRNTKGYAYRLVFHDKELGPIATPWDAKLNTDYIYATIPKELKEKKQDWVKVGIEAAKIVLSTDANGAVSKEQQVLDKFSKVLDVVADKGKK
jgi:hypothetical protein